MIGNDDDGPDDWEFYDDDLDEIYGRVKESPDCGGCTDSGRMKLRSRWWRGEKTINCPDCNPTKWQHRMWWWRWRLSQARLKLTPARFRPVYDDGEAPF